MSLEDALDNWSKWCWQGATLAAGYPPESCTEMMDAVQYKGVGDTIEEHIAYLERKSVANEPAAKAVEEVVCTLPIATATAVRARYVYLPESDRHDAYMTFEQAERKRAAITGQFLRAATGIQRAVSLEEYEQRVEEALSILGRLERWAA